MLSYGANMAPEEKISILIVDDDTNIRYLLETATTRDGGFEIVAALEDGAVALEWLNRQETEELPDFVLTDLSMPRLTGLDLVKAMKANERLRQIPVAIITSSNIPNDREDAYAAGVCEFIQKPHGLDALTKVMAGLRTKCAELTAKRHHAA